ASCSSRAATTCRKSSRGSRPRRSSMSPDHPKSGRPRHSRAKRSHITAALVLRRAPYRDAEQVVKLFCESLVQSSALARAARKRQRRCGGALERFPTIEAELDEVPGAGLMVLPSVRVEPPRTRLYDHLAGMEAAGRFLNWLR